MTKFTLSIKCVQAGLTENPAADIAYTLRALADRIDAGVRFDAPLTDSVRADPETILSRCWVTAKDAIGSFETVVTPEPVADAYLIESLERPGFFVHDLSAEEGDNSYELATVGTEYTYDSALAFAELLCFDCDTPSVKLVPVNRR